MPHHDSPDNLVRTLLAAVRQIPGKQGRTITASVLRGSTDKRIADTDLDQSDAHGRLAHYTRSQLETMLDVLVEAELLARDKFRCLVLTSEGRAILEGQTEPSSSLLENIDHAAREADTTPRSTDYYAGSKTLAKTLKLLEDRHGLSDIAADRDLTLDTVADHLLALAERGYSFEVPNEVDEERIEDLRRAARRWHPGEPLSDVRQNLDEQWEWYEIKTGLAAVVLERHEADSGHRVKNGFSRQRREAGEAAGAPLKSNSRRGREAGEAAGAPQFKSYHGAKDDDSEEATMYSRGYLPHCDRRDRPQFITYRLGDALPAPVVERIRREADDEHQATARMERYLDAGHGACWLERPDFAEVVVENLRFHDGSLYRLLDWVVMPNHVHVLFDRPRADLDRLLHSWKSYTSQQLKSRTDLGENESFWQRGFFDRYIRDPRHHSNVESYIYLNPVKATLVTDPFDWKWSSLHKHDDIRPRLRSWWRAESQNFWTCVEKGSNE